MFNYFTAYGNWQVVPALHQCGEPINKYRMQAGFFRVPISIQE